MDQRQPGIPPAEDLDRQARERGIRRRSAAAAAAAAGGILSLTVALLGPTATIGTAPVPSATTMTASSELS